MIDELTKTNNFATDELNGKPHGRNGEPDMPILGVLPVVRKIVNRKNFAALRNDKPDLLQIVVLRLWRWRTRRPEQSEAMRENEWQAIAARTTYNEINRYFEKQRINEPLETAAEIVSDEKIVGNSNAELESLARFAWQAVCKLTVRQRRALLLQNQDLIVKLSFGGVSEADFAEALEFDLSRWLKMKNELPLTDIRIAETCAETGDKHRLAAAAKSIKKARHEARAKLGGILR